MEQIQCTYVLQVYLFDANTPVTVTVPVSYLTPSNIHDINSMLSCCSDAANAVALPLLLCCADLGPYS